MSEQTIDFDDLSGHELNRMIARELGIKSCLFPCYAENIEVAWELDGDGWLWRTIETPYGVEVFNQFASAYVLFADFPTKAIAYATARCRAWLKAKHD